MKKRKNTCQKSACELSHLDLNTVQAENVSEELSHSELNTVQAENVSDN